jgi:hypothetical protein
LIPRAPHLNNAGEEIAGRNENSRDAEAPFAPLAREFPKKV